MAELQLADHPSRSADGVADATDRCGNRASRPKTCRFCRLNITHGSARHLPLAGLYLGSHMWFRCVVDGHEWRSGETAGAPATS
jgi:hypothetical protein